MYLLERKVKVSLNLNLKKKRRKRKRKKKRLSLQLYLLLPLYLQLNQSNLYLILRVSQSRSNHLFLKRMRKRVAAVMGAHLKLARLKISFKGVVHKSALNRLWLSSQHMFLRKRRMIHLMTITSSQLVVERARQRVEGEEAALVIKTAICLRNALRNPLSQALVVVGEVGLLNQQC
jgi:hypothetical protein